MLNPNVRPDWLVGHKNALSFPASHSQKREEPERSEREAPPSWQSVEWKHEPEICLGLLGHVGSVQGHSQAGLLD